MRISDWSSDVCSSDLPLMLAHVLETARPGEKLLLVGFGQGADALIFEITDAIDTARPRAGVSGAIANGLVTDSYLRMLSDRKSVVEGKRVSVRVGLGGRR